MVSDPKILIELDSQLCQLQIQHYYKDSPAFPSKSHARIVTKYDMNYHHSILALGRAKDSVLQSLRVTVCERLQVGPIYISTSHLLDHPPLSMTSLPKQLLLVVQCSWCVCSMEVAWH